MRVAKRQFHFLPHATFNNVSPRPARAGIHLAVVKREESLWTTFPLPMFPANSVTLTMRLISYVQLYSFWTLLDKKASPAVGCAVL